MCLINSTECILYSVVRFLSSESIPERDPQSVGAAEPDGVEKVTASELAGADVEQTPERGTQKEPIKPYSSYMYRVTIQDVSWVVLTSKQRLHFSIRSIY